MEKELLEQALKSILHGSTQIVSSDNGNGQISHQEVRINDLRIPLIQKIAEGLVRTEAFREVMIKAFTPEIIKKMQETALAGIKYSDLDYNLRQRVEREMKDMKVEVKNYKLVAETITPPLLTN